jgi:YD repeat-containing protein
VEYFVVLFFFSNFAKLKSDAIMMNINVIKGFTLCLCSLFQTVSFAQNYNCKEMGLKGNVKNIRETQYKMNEVNPGLNEILLTTISFNKNCQKIEETTTDVGGDLKNNHKISYDKSGNIISENKETPTVNGVFLTKYKYNASKQLINKEVISNKRIIATYIYHYDDKGNAVKKEIQKELGLLDIHNENFDCKYDDNHRLIEEIHLDGKEYKKTGYQYNEKDQITRRTEYNERGGITYESIFVYDELDNLSTETATYRDNKTFDYSYIYEYDNQGNWINKRSLSDEKTYSLQIRIITYF